MSRTTLPEGLFERLAEVNRARRSDASGHSLEKALEHAYSCHSKLAVYGSLAPGKANHHVVADLRGRWLPDLVTHGDLMPQGWGAALGYPAMRWRLGASPVDIQLFESNDLPLHWPRLDDFEGPEYCRILVPVFAGASFYSVANLYEASQPDS